MFSRDELDKYRSFIVCREDDADLSSKEPWLSASNKETRKTVILSVDSSRSRLIEKPDTKYFPETHYSITADRAFEMLSNGLFISE